MRVVPAIIVLALLAAGALLTSVSQRQADLDALCTDRPCQGIPGRYADDTCWCQVGAP